MRAACSLRQRVLQARHLLVLVDAVEGRAGNEIVVVAGNQRRPSGGDRAGARAHTLPPRRFVVARGAVGDGAEDLGAEQRLRGLQVETLQQRLARVKAGIVRRRVEGARAQRVAVRVDELLVMVERRRHRPHAGVGVCLRIPRVHEIEQIGLRVR